MMVIRLGHTRGWGDNTTTQEKEKEGEDREIDDQGS